MVARWGGGDVFLRSMVHLGPSSGGGGLKGRSRGL